MFVCVCGNDSEKKQITKLFYLTSLHHNITPTHLLWFSLSKHPSMLGKLPLCCCVFSCIMMMIDECVWHGDAERDGATERERPRTRPRLMFRTDTSTQRHIHTFSTYTLSHINTLNWGNGYTVTHLAALWAKGCDEPWKNLLSPSHTHSLRQSETDTGRGWMENNSKKNQKHIVDYLGNTLVSAVISNGQFECRKLWKVVFLFLA